MTRRMEPIYVWAALLALLVHASVLALSWEAAPVARIQSQGEPGVEIRLGGAPAAAASGSLAEPVQIPEPEPLPQPTPPPPVPTPSPVAEPVPAPRLVPRPRPSAVNTARTAQSGPAADVTAAHSGEAGGSGGSDDSGAVGGTSPEPLGALQNKSPQYPKLARQRGQGGEVSLKVEVSAEGQALNVLLQKSSGHALLDKAALDAVKKWRFRPARRDGAAVPGEALVIVEFRLE